ncbi:hypothetical protein, partial [Streptomyces sp. NPDC001975]
GRCRNPHRTQKALTHSRTQPACHQRPGTAHLAADLLNPETFGKAVVRRVADSASDAPDDRIKFVNEDGEDLLTEWGLKD